MAVVVREQQALVPSLWALEASNVIARAEATDLEPWVEQLTTQSATTVSYALAHMPLVPPPALADAVARHLASVNRCYTLFATHYFELTALASEPGSGIANVHLDAVEHGDTLVFMHAVKDGAADRSFGLQVAALAGLPKTTLQQARRRLAELEQRGRETHASDMAPQALDAPQQFGLFAAPSAAQEALAAIDPDELTPKQALESLYRLKALL